jgi:hypothetical protein
MSTPDETESVVSQVTRTLQIIEGALVAGLLIFLAITVALNMQPRNPRPPGEPPPARTPFLIYVALAFAAMSMPMSALVPRMIATNARKQIARGTWVPGRRPMAQMEAALAAGKEVPDEIKLLGVYQTQTIVGATLNEGAAFFAIIVNLIEPSSLALGLALVLIAAMLPRFPTRGKVEQWLVQQVELVRQERALGG